MLENALKKIEKWLQQHAKRIARLSLRSPVSEAKLLQLEEVAGKPLPADFKQLYRWHDGLTDEENTGSLVYGLDFWPISRVLSAYQARLANHATVSLSQADSRLDAANLFNPGWVQFCSDGSRTGLFLDLAPSSTGT